MDKESFESAAIWYANWNGHSSFPRYYGVRDAFIDSLTSEEKEIMTKLGYFDSSTKNGKRFEKAIQRTSGKDKVDADFYAMYNEAMGKASSQAEPDQPGNC
ncbi:MAG: hypothetical protein IJA23_05645 [Clostridia bacterium]|nr:hypothetical protein [Clostridia bacterium]